MAEQIYIFAASSAQRSLWFLEQLAPGSALYNLHTAARLSSQLNVDALERSINEIVQRHESLRTGFKDVEGEPVQAVVANLEVKLQVSDFTSEPEAGREEAAYRLLAEETAKPFDLSTWPLIRAHLVRLDLEDYVLLVVFHHIVCDFWSVEIFERELNILYEAFCAGQPSPLPELPIQYGDFAEWQSEWLQGAEAAAHLDYWKKQLADLPVLQLPTDWPRPLEPSFAGAEHGFWLDERIYESLLRLSQRENLTLFMTLLAGLQILFHRYSDQSDFVVGTPIANRTRAELENLIGFFVNSLVLRADLSGNPTAAELFARVRETALEAYAHQDLPFEALVRELKPERELGQNPLFDVHFQLLKDIGSSHLSSTLTGDIYEIENETAKFDLAIDFWEYPDGLWANFEYSTDLFSEQTIARMEGHFRTLLRAMLANPEFPISELPILSEAERRQLIRDWNNTAVSYDRDRCLHHLFEAQVELTPGAIAVIFQGEQLTYAELNRRSNQLAHRLIARGAGPDVIVGICAERSIEMITGLLGILKAGGAYLPLDPSYPAERLHFMLQETRSRLLLSQARLGKTIAANGLQTLFLDDDQAFGPHSDDNPATNVGSSNLAYVIYTSGSTGKPKGVMVHSQAVCNHLRFMQTAFPLGTGDLTVLKYPFNFDASVYEIFGPLMAGATLVVSDPSLHWDISEFIQLLTEKRITALDVVPSMLDVLLDEGAFSVCPALKRITCGGEPLSVELRDRFFSKSEAELHNIYGPTEATIGASSCTCLADALEEAVPIGLPIANTQIYILDSRLNPLPVGVSGELCIGGDGIARGYLNHPELTAEKFIPDPFSKGPGGRLYKTGDRARRSSGGNIEYLGRLDQQIKLRGYRIELGEIETTLAQHPSIRGCAVAAIEEADHMRLAAYVVPASEPAELWPSVGEYDVYDEFLYYAMTHDESRNRAYQAAIEAAVEDKIVLDIGTGADAILARMCVDAGAARVYAIESGREAYNRAHQLIDHLALRDKVTIIHGDSAQTELPETVDVCVSELIGMIGSSEGVVTILNDARRFLKGDGVTIPRRCATRIAAVSLPDTLNDQPSFAEIPGAYVSRIFEKAGHAFDLRLCVRNFPLAHIVSSDAVFEDFEFNGPVDPEFERDIKLTISKNCTLQGFLLWLNLFPADDEPIDSLNMRTSWLPVFWPAFYPGIEVSEGDVVQATCQSRLAPGGRMPDYQIKGVLIRRSNASLTFTYESPHHAAGLGQNPFYRTVFQHYDAHFRSSPPSDRTDHDQIPTERSHSLVPALRRFLRERLPDHMVPASFVLLDELPITSSGKLDRAALAAIKQGTADRVQPYVEPRNERETLLASIWAELLGVERVGIHDNFFDLGGDSILSIQIIARANQAGLHLRPAQLFQYQTIAEIAEASESAPVAQAEEEQFTGLVPLTPVQQWFFEQDLIDRHHYNQSLLVEAPHGVDKTRLTSAFNELLKYHDALRFRFTVEGFNWTQTVADAASIDLVEYDLSSLSKSAREDAFSRAALELQTSLNLSTGPLLAVALINWGASGGPYLLIVIHHLVVDGVSWRVLLEDLWAVYGQLSDGQEAQLPPKTTPFQIWARRVTAYAHSSELERDAEYWLTMAPAEESRVPRDFPEGSNTGASARSVVVALDTAETRALLQEVPKAYHTQINDVLLTALLEAFSEWSGTESIYIDLEGHGREAIISDVDLSRTIGWFTTIFPVHLHKDGSLWPGDLLRSVKELLRRIPSRGISFGLLRYLSQNEHLRHLLGELPRPEIAFNYLGQYAPTYSENGYSRRLSELSGPAISPRSQRSYLLEIDGSVIEGRLEMIWTYSEAAHRRSTIRDLAETFMRALRELISHCQMPMPGGYTPSDFARAKLSQRELDKLMSKLR